MEKEKNRIWLTDYNTIASNSYSFDEMTVSDFLDNIEKNKDYKSHSIKYDRENKCFLVKYDYIKYIFTLDDKLMENYEIGKYNDVTTRIKKLVDYFDRRVFEEDEEVYSKEEINEKIIEKGESGKKLIDPKEREIYLKYLKKRSIIYFFSIFRTISFSSIGIGCIGYMIFSIANLSLLTPFKILYPLIILIVSMAIDFGIAISYPLDNGFGLKNIKNNLQKLKINKSKIKQLEKDNGLNNSKKKLNPENEPIREDVLKFSDEVMKGYNEVLDIVDTLNKEDRDRLFRKTESDIGEYLAKIGTIIKKKHNGPELSLEDLMKLKLDFFSKIADIKQEAYDIKEKDNQYNKVLKDKELIDSRMKKDNEQQVAVSRR